MRVSDLAKEKKWWIGPDFLQKEESDWPVNQSDTNKVSAATEIKKTAQASSQAGRSNGDWTVISVHEDDQLWRLDPKRYSSWKKLIRIQAWVRRFIDNCRSSNREKGELKAEKIEDVAIQVIKGAQRKAYPDEYLALQRQREIAKKSKLLGLQPWLDEEGQMRCNGRLKYAEYLPQDARFPIILPRKNCATKLIVKHYHEKKINCCRLYQHASGSLLVVKKSGNGIRNAMNAKEEKLKLQDKLWPLSHRLDLDFP